MPQHVSMQRGREVCISAPFPLFSPLALLLLLLLLLLIHSLSVVDNQGEVGLHTVTEIESGITWLHAAMGYTSATKGTYTSHSAPPGPAYRTTEFPSPPGLKIAKHLYFAACRVQ